eukprot:Skav224491  [mRNA]  locus=scaffold1294:49504:50601:+ [translate_table: standard]
MNRRSPTISPPRRPSCVVSLPGTTTRKQQSLSKKSLLNSLRKAQSAKVLLVVLGEALDGTIFSFLHVSVAYSSLAWWKTRGRGGLQLAGWEGSVVARLHARVEEMVKKGELDAQATSNTLLSIAKFSDWPIPKELVSALAESIPTKVNHMMPQHLSKCLWACARLREVAPVLQAVPAIVNQIIGKAKGMKAQELSTCLWACAHLNEKENAPLLLEGVPAIAAQIPDKAFDMIPQDLSNCLWACARLKEAVPDVLQAVPGIAAQIPGKAWEMVPQHLSSCLWATLQLEADAPKVLDIVPIIVMEVQSKVKDMSAEDLSNILEALVLLQESFPEVAQLVADVDSKEHIIRSAAARLNIMLPWLQGKD